MIAVILLIVIILFALNSIKIKNKETESMVRPWDCPDYYEDLFYRWISINDQRPLFGFYMFVANKDGSIIKYCRYAGKWPCDAKDKMSYVVFKGSQNYSAGIDFDPAWWTPSAPPPNITSFEGNR